MMVMNSNTAMKSPAGSTILGLFLAVLCHIPTRTHAIQVNSLRSIQQHATQPSVGTRRNVLEKILVVPITSATMSVASSVLAPTIASAAEESKSSVKTFASRLDADTLTMPPPSRSSELNGVDNLYYPSWLEGEWDVTQTMKDASTPLGLKYIGGPKGDINIATTSFTEQRRQIEVPVNLNLKFVKTKFGVAEDRVFNQRARLDGFAGRKVVSSVEYANVGGSNRASVLALGGTEDDPLQTTVVRYRGPAAQKTFVLSHGADRMSNGDGESTEPKKWAGYEVLRSIFALTNTNTSPPITTDTELIWYFEQVDNNNVKGRLRIASYLNAQSDLLYFEARNRAVSYADYELKMKKII